MRRSISNVLIFFPMGAVAGLTLTADLRHLPAAGRPVEACENIRLGGEVDQYNCDCQENACGWAKDCAAGWEPCNENTPDFVCHTRGHEGEKCVYANGDTYGECPPDGCGDDGGGGTGGGGGGDC
jgi:hypothetical protein